jgi:hypothetical protein
MKKTKLICLSFISALAMLMAISLCYAATATTATLHTTDVAGNDKVQFNLGETVYIRWTADGTVNIEVKYEDGTTDGQWLNQPNTGVIAYNPTKGAGYYSIYCMGVRVKLIAYGTFMVIPEIPLGVIAATVACFAGFGLKSIRAKKN